MSEEFDKKLGGDFIAQVPDAPGVYLFYDGSGALLYVGKAKSLRRRLQQYRLAGRKKAQRKMRLIVRKASALNYEICASERAALLRENQLIQEHRPPLNIAGAFAFLYPYLGIKRGERLLSLCYTTQGAAMQEHGFELWGAFRSRDTVGEAYEALINLLSLIGHLDQSERELYSAIPYTRIAGFRQLDPSWAEDCAAFFAGQSARCLERLVAELLEKPRARRQAAEVQTQLKVLRYYFVSEAQKLRLALTRSGRTAAWIAQEERDQLFLGLDQDD